MESTTFKTNRLLWLLLAVGVGATLVAWQQKQKSPRHTEKTQVQADTIPSKHLKVRNLDEALEGLDKVNIDIDLEKVNTELAKLGPELQKEISRAGIEAARAIKEIDFPKINAEINNSLANIDWPKIKIDVDGAMAKVDWPKIKIDVDGAMAKVDWDKLKISLDKLKDIDAPKMEQELKKLDIELKKINPEIQINLDKVRIEIDKAKTTLKEYKNFVDGLEKDGLINKNDDYTIKHTNGELIINGKTQSADVYNKYRNFLEKHKSLRIEKSSDDFSVDNDD
jgi:hypothetical protein